MFLHDLSLRYQTWRWVLVSKSNMRSSFLDTKMAGSSSWLAMPECAVDRLAMIARRAMRYYGGAGIHTGVLLPAFLRGEAVQGRPLKRTGVFVFKSSHTHTHTHRKLISNSQLFILILKKKPPTGPGLLLYYSFDDEFHLHTCHPVAMVRWGFLFKVTRGRSLFTKLRWHDDDEITVSWSLRTRPR